MKKNQREENSTTIMVITKRFFGVLGFLDSNPPNVGRDSLFIQVVSVLIRLQSSALFEHLTAYLRGG